MTTMYMTEKLANRIMDDLVCLGISAIGGCPTEGLSEETIERLQRWARTTFISLCESWETEDSKWEILEEEE